MLKFSGTKVISFKYATPLIFFIIWKHFLNDLDDILCYLKLNLFPIKINLNWRVRIFNINTLKSKLFSLDIKRSIPMIGKRIDYMFKFKINYQAWCVNFKIHICLCIFMVKV